jgi:hypothetical protein
VHVDQRDVGRLRPDETQPLFRGPRLSSDPDIRLLLEDHPETRANQFMVVDQYYVNHVVPSLGRLYF